MILVTGTKRSGTSMWMQILTAAGFPYVGSKFMQTWEDSIKDANPKGFFESPLRKGVYYATNPNSKTGTYLHPKAAEKHVLKVFIPGLIRTDYAYIQRVVATIRPWREYCASITRLYAIEDEFMKTAPQKKSEPLPPLEMARLRRPAMHPALEWWRENYDLIRDFATRRYAFNLVSYSKLLEDPVGVITPVLRWCGAPDIEKGVAEVDKSLRTQKKVRITDSPLTSEQETLFDEFHDYFFRQEPLSGAFIQKMNEIDIVLRPMIDDARKEGQKRLRDVLVHAGLQEHEAEKELEKAQEEAR
jgi:hypothetical protein